MLQLSARRLCATSLGRANDGGFMTKRAHVLSAVALLACALALLSGCGRHAQDPRDSTIMYDIATVQVAIGDLATDNSDSYPPAERVSLRTLRRYVGADWPMNPFDGLPMHPGTTPGDFHYVPSGEFTGSGYSSYVLIGYGANGEPVITASPTPQTIASPSP